MQEDAKILALDVATNTGWAYGGLGRKIEFGSVRFGKRGDEPERRYAAAAAWAGQFLREHEADAVVIERPVPNVFFGGRTNHKTARMLIGLSSVVMAEAAKDGSRYVADAAPADVRRYFLGGRAIKSAEAKRRTVQRCRDLGFPVANDNEADAVALLLYTVGTWFGKEITYDCGNEADTA